MVNAGIVFGPTMEDVQNGGTLMEIEKLIKHMREEAQDYRIGRTLGRAFADAEDVLDEAATALEQLQAENDRLKRERDAAVEDLNAIIGDIEEIRRGYGVDNGDADSAFADLCGNYCANKSHRCYVEAEKYRCNNFKWRGPKEE